MLFALKTSAWVTFFWLDTRVWRYFFFCRLLASSAVNFLKLVSNRLNELDQNWSISRYYSFGYRCDSFLFMLVYRKMDPERRIRFIAKYIGTFCFQMKGAAVFDWTVLRCNHLLFIDCFKKNKDILKAMRSCQCGASFPRERIWLYSNAHPLSLVKWQQRRCSKLIMFRCNSFFNHQHYFALLN